MIFWLIAALALCQGERCLGDGIANSASNASQANPAFTGSLSSTGNYVASGPFSSQFLVSHNFSGFVNSGQAYGGQIVVNSDNTNTTGQGGPGGLTNLTVGTVSGGAGATGNRTSLLTNIQHNKTSGNVSTQIYYTSLSARASASVNDNGVDGGPSGNLFAFNPLAVLHEGSTFWNSIVTAEDDLQVEAGASVAYKVGHKIVLGSTDAVAGTNSNIGLSIAAGPASTTPGFTYGISFGDPQGTWAFNSSSTLIGAQNTNLPGPQYAAKYGIDFSNINFSGAPLVMPPKTPASSAAPCSPGAIEWDANFIYVCAAQNTWKRAALSTF